MKTLREARIANGWTQHALAQVACLSTVTLSHIENGKTNPQDLTKRRIEIACGPIDWDETRKQAVVISNGHKTAIETQS